MKKVLVFMLCLLAVFAVVSCKDEPAESGTVPVPAPDPDETQPIAQPGVLDIRPAEDVEWNKETNWTQPKKFQFKLDVEFNSNESIDLFVKCSDAFKSIAVRQAGGDNTKFKVNGSEDQDLESLEKDEDGWYIVSIPAESVTPKSSTVDQSKWTGLGITLYFPEEIEEAWTQPCYVAIKGLKLNDEYFDITLWDAESCVQSYYNSPKEFSVTLTLDD
jgi:hypothetical protein